MPLNQFTRSVDGSIPIQALLYTDEELHTTQEGVGIYDGLQKSPEHQSGAIHLTSHRLFYVDSQSPETHSFEMDLSLIERTEYYAGLFTSSPKVTCHLSGIPSASVPTESESAISTGFESWECEVCAFRNPPGLSPAAARICALCGVPRTAVPGPTASVSSQQHLSSSLPSSVLSSPSLSSRKTLKDSISCPACTFLNHPSLRECEICSTQLPRLKRELKSAPSSRPITPAPDVDNVTTSMIKISFRKGGDKSFYAILKRTLKAKAWESTGNGLAPIQGPNQNDPESRNAVGKSGISGILMKVENSAQGREIQMQDAFQDLEALMVKAKDMVKLAAELNEKLSAANSGISSEPEEATFIRSSLSQLGLQMSNKPVTLDMMKDERKWFEELARELARILQGPLGSNDGDKIRSGMMKDRGIIALDEVWGGWNRARGVALIPPSTFLQVVPILPSYTSPVIHHRSFASGLNVVHTPRYTNSAFTARLSAFLVTDGPKTTIDIATEENLTVSLASEMIDVVEKEGGVCRDDAGAAVVGGAGGTAVEIKWWANLFVGYIWDGQE